jgi:DNA repair exonuclease SbcCD ATPase subunit
LKIKNIKVNAYGNIENKDINLEEGINIIHGANESGKSTLLNYIISIFYGISRNKDGKALSDYEKYKPWNSNEFSGRISYKLENGEKYEIFRDFNKKNPKIYNDKLEDISDRFETDKKDGSKFFIEQMGIDKQMYLSTVVEVLGSICITVPWLPSFTLPLQSYPSYIIVAVIRGSLLAYG